MTKTAIISSVLFGVVALGCVARDLGGDGESTGTSGAETGASGVTSSGDGDPTTPTSGGPTSGPPGSSSSSPPDPSGGTMTGESGEPAETGVEFIISPDHGGDPCDTFAQDCPEGQKCMPWASDGGNSWNDTRCVEVTGDQKPGELCMAEGGGLSGEDDCVEGAMCWNVDQEGAGVCIAMCTGSPEQPMCAEGSFCAINGDGVLTLCLPICDPLAQDCPGDDLCLPVNDTFVCVLDASGDAGQAFDPCEFANACDPGLLCAPTQSASECDAMAAGCCSPMCSISKMAPPCPGVGQACISVWAEGMAPPEFADIGFCSLPL